MWYEEDEEAEGRVREKSKVDLVTGLLELVGLHFRTSLTAAETIFRIGLQTGAGKAS